MLLAGAVVFTPANKIACRVFEFGKRTCKPNSVVCGHSSRRRVAADAHQRPTRRFRSLHWSNLAAPGQHRARYLLRARASLPIWSCSVWGLPCLRRYRRSGALLPHHFTLTGLAVQAIALRASCARQSTSIRRYIFCGTGRPWVLRPTSRMLSGTLPCGVRTFLPRRTALAHALRQRPPGPPASS